jgi:hypothetical protein
VSLLNAPIVRRLRELAALRLLRRMHRITHRLPVKLRAIERARLLVVAPHMDDDVIGPGGTLVLHQRLQSEVNVVFCAAGATPEQDRTRKAETEAAARFMGFARVAHLNFPEGSMSLHEAAMAQKLGGLLLELKPEQVFCPFVSDHHRDHTAVALALAQAIRKSGWRGEVWCFEVWSGVVAEKRQAIDLYASQVAGLHYADGTLGLNRYRALRVYVQHAEAFYVTDHTHFVSLAEEMNTL